MDTFARPIPHSQQSIRPYFREEVITPLEHYMDVHEVIATGVDRAQRRFELLKREIDVRKDHRLADVTAKSIICDASIGRGVDAPQHFGKDVLRHYLAPAHEDFQPRNLWSLSNAFTSAFGELEPVPQMRAAASLAPFLQQYQ